jgi:hypothetical protein
VDIAPVAFPTPYFRISAAPWKPQASAGNSVYMYVLIGEHSRVTMLRTPSSKAEVARALLDMITGNGDSDRTQKQKSS